MSVIVFFLLCIANLTIICCSLAAVFFCQNYESGVKWSVKSGYVADEKLNLMRPVVVLETLNLARYVTTP